MKGKKLDTEEVVLFLRERGTPTTNAEGAGEFECSTETFSRHCGEARDMGYVVLPTKKGQWYVKKIATKEELNLLLGAIDWMNRCKASAAKMLSVAKEAMKLIPPKWQEEKAS